MYWPFFQLGCNLEINAQRTSAYLANVSDICEEGEFRGAQSLTCNCPPLYWAVPEDSSDPIVAATYTTPSADQAPWLDADIPESAQFLGFLIHQVTESQSVAGRAITTRVSSSGGGVLGPIRYKERRYDFEVLLFACNELSMEYGMRYLADALGSSGCDEGCTTCDAEFRDSCPPIDGTPDWDDINRGRWILKNVGALGGPVWMDPPLEGMQCNVRMVQFSIVSELPWKFKCEEVLCDEVALAGYPADGTDCVNWSDILCGTQEVSCSVDANTIIGEEALIIEVQAGSVPLQHIQIAVRPDKFGYECDEDSRPVGYQRMEPCDLIYIPEIPASSRLIYDTATESIRVRFAGGGEVDGSPYIATDEGRPPTFPSVRCGTFCVSVSVSECSVIGDPYVTISSVHREI